MKRFFKRIPFLVDINAYLKATGTQKKYRQTCIRYLRNDNPKDMATLFQHQLGSHISKFRRLERPFHVLFLGTDELQDRGGMIQALDKSSELKLFTRSDGSYGQNHPGSWRKRQRKNSERLIEIVAQFHAGGWNPDLIIAQTWASFMSPQAIARVKQQTGALFINISMDDRHQYWGEKIDNMWGGTYGLIPVTDLTLTAAPECVDWYLQEGCPAIFFPEASDLEIFHPMPHLPKIHDVSFVGGRYGIREKIVNALRDNDVGVSAYGSGWENGRIDTDHVPALFAQSKIILGVGTIGHCTDFFSLKMRDFDGPMSGSFYLTHDNPDLRRLYEVDKEIVTFRTIDECVKTVKYYLHHDKERERIARSGRMRAAAEHTWEKRFENLFALLTESSD